MFPKGPSIFLKHVPWMSLEETLLSPARVTSEPRGQMRTLCHLSFHCVTQPSSSGAQITRAARLEPNLRGGFGGLQLLPQPLLCEC